MKTVLFIFFLFLPAAPAAALDLSELIRQVEMQYTGGSSRAEVGMEIATDNWRRLLEMNSWSLGRDYFLTRITDPPKERGVSTLKAGNEVWNYLPKVDRVIKVPASMMGGSWMGSHITNDDLVKASRVDEDYTFKLLEETDDLLRIEAIPQPDAAVVWGKIVYEIAKPHNVPRTIEYFDEEMDKVRQIAFDRVEEIDGRHIPLRMTVQPLDAPGERTVITYRNLEFDVPVEKDFFSLRSLKKR